MKRITVLVLLSVALAAFAWVGLRPAWADVPVAGPEFTAVVNATAATSGVSAIATSASNIISVKAVTLSSDTAGVVLLLDGNNSGTVLGAFYLAANTPRDVGSDLLGPGLNTTSGQGVFVRQASGTVTAVFRYRLER